jgi:(1->4)-alpha-D-glucan 1-alpha-D-glucosylmutase
MADSTAGSGGTTGKAPVSTYRLQLHAGFGFAAAAEQVPYLAALGVSHLYLSPILQATPGSLHGYDVIDHSQVSHDLGGDEQLVRLADTAHAHGLGIVVDVVPNHMAVPAPLYQNRQLWEVLRDGQASRFAHWFDVDWEVHEGKVGLPVLGDRLAEVVSRGDLTVDQHSGQPVLRYFDQVFPVRPGSADGDPLSVAQRQHYRLESWLEKNSVLNYRRFFDVDTLVAVRVELPDVFESTHTVLLELHQRGLIDGFRIDHPDGLADPEGYLEMLRDATGGAWVVAEKILEGDEELPRSWPTAGTTGYDAITAIAQALAPETGAHLTHRWIETGGDPDLHAVEELAKRDVIDSLFQPELRRLSRVAAQAAADAGQQADSEHADQYAEALAELLAHVDAYRAYVRPGRDVDADSVDRIHRLCDRAAKARPGMADTFDVLRGLLLDSSTSSAAGRDLLVRFGQTCGPVMAKGVEDTTFYRFHRLVALNEVGGDPSLLDRPDPQALHAWAAREAEHWPRAMTTLSTHDTKRSEDVRSRLLAAAGDSDGWDATWALVRSQAQHAEVDLPTAYLLFQTLVGAWPIDEQRLVDYLRKAVREGKQHTTWTEVNAEYEERVFSLARTCLQTPTISAVEDWLEGLQPAIRAMTLATKLLELTLPGVPDTYQGTELVDLSLVDPDNRRAVDYSDRTARLRALDAGGGAHDLHDEKLLITSRALRARQAHAELVSGDYAALATDSPHVLAFVRGGAAVTVVTRWPNRMSDWGAQTLTVPAGQWRDAFTGAVHDGGPVRVRDLLASLPVTLLLKDTA